MSDIKGTLTTAAGFEKRGAAGSVLDGLALLGASGSGITLALVSL